MHGIPGLVSLAQHLAQSGVSTDPKQIFHTTPFDASCDFMHHLLLFFQGDRIRCFGMCPALGCVLHALVNASVFVLHIKQLSLHSCLRFFMPNKNI